MKSASVMPSDDRQSWHPLAGGYPPLWATAWGEDQYGVFANATVFNVSFCLRWIPPGQFQIGSPEIEDSRFEDERPQTQITIERGYWFMDAPVNQALWEAVMRDNPSMFQSPDRPVEQVSWDEIAEFLIKLNEELVGVSFRLPSESEWEYACRAGSEEATYAGALKILGERNAPILDEIAWYGGNSGVDFELEDGHDSSSWPEKQYEHSKTGTHPVRQKRPNRWGCYDLLGNVYEWCEDVWSESHDGIDLTGRARLGGNSSKEKEARVVRGGSWFSYARSVRAASRLTGSPVSRSDALGFRCVLGQAGSVERDVRLLEGREAEPRPGAK